MNISHEALIESMAVFLTEEDKKEIRNKQYTRTLEKLFKYRGIEYFLDGDYIIASVGNESFRLLLVGNELKYKDSVPKIVKIAIEDTYDVGKFEDYYR